MYPKKMVDSMALASEPKEPKFILVDALGYVKDGCV